MDKNKVTALILAVILVIVTAWSVLGTRGSHGPVIYSNRIVIPSEGDNLNSPVSKYFGRAPYFIVYDAKKDGFWMVSNIFYQEKHAAGLRAAAMLVRKGVGIAVAQNIGPEPARYFNNNKVKVYLGASGTVRDAINQYKSGRLVTTEKPNVPTHYGMPGAKPCPNVMGQPQKRIPPDQLRQDKNLVAAGWIPYGVVRHMIGCPYCKRRMLVSINNFNNLAEVACPFCHKIIALRVMGAGVSSWPVIR